MLSEDYQASDNILALGEGSSTPTGQDTSTQKLIVDAAYMVSSVLFILALGGLSHPQSSKRGNFFGMIGMLIAIVSTFFLNEFQKEYVRFFIPLAVASIIGTILALTVKMTQMPQMVALLHSFVGAAATLVSFAAYFINEDHKAQGFKLELPVLHSIETYIGLWVGAITFSGSVIAFIKFAGLCKGLCDGPLTCIGSFRHLLNLIIMLAIVTCGVFFCLDDKQVFWLYINTGLSIFLGFHLILAIGAADMPVIVSMLNSYSGWATSASGFLLDNNLLIITGALVGSSGAILSYIMCRAMNRSFISVLLGGFGATTSSSGEKVDVSKLVYKEFNTDQLIQVIQKSKNIIVVPGYGMAASGAHFVVGKLQLQLRKLKKKVRFCIHPVAGRLPGHMDILLSDARVPYNLMEQLQKIGDDFEKTDLVLVIGANDIVNPIALDPKSPIGGMPVCECWNAKQVVVLKRGMKNKGFAAIDNPLFYNQNTAMYLGDAKKNIESLVNAFKALSGETGGEQAVQIEGAVEEQKEVVHQDTPEEIDQKYPVISQIGVLKETTENERRVAISPTLVIRFRKLGFGILVQSGAGEAAGWSDAYFVSKGAKIAESAEEVAKNCTLLVKICEPNEDELQLLDYPKYFLSYINPERNQDLHKALIQKNNLTTLAIEQIPRITRAQKMDTLSSMATVAGYRAIIEAFNHFPRYSKGVSSAAGKIYPATVFVIGIGVAGLSAIGTAKGLGAIVRAYDTRKPAQEQAASLGAEVVTVQYVEEGGGIGGYAKEMSEGYKQAQANMLRKQLPKCDIIITTAMIPGKPAPILVEQEVVANMKPGSVIVDLAAMGGGNCPLTEKGELIVVQNYGVTIIGYTDFPSRMAQQSSDLYATNVFNLVEEICGAHLNKTNNANNWNLDFDDEIITDVAITHKGNDRFIPYQKKMQIAKAKAASQAKDQAPKQSSQSQPQYKGKVSKQTEVLIPKDEFNEGVMRPKDTVCTVFLRYFWVFVVVAICTTIMTLIAWQTNLNFIGHLLAFVLAIFVGYKVIWNVTPALHTPLMSVTNAISGIIVVGAMLQLHGPVNPWEASAIMGLLALGLASINVVGGFMVTQRMLSKFVRI